jgi:hypothetical protein
MLLSSANEYWNSPMVRPKVFRREKKGINMTRIGRMRETILLWFYRFELASAFYMLDPWEQYLLCK